MNLKISHPLLWLLASLLAACSSPGDAQPSREEARARYAKAEAMFQERCKTAGEKIHRTAENVEGVYLLKLRSEEINYGEQFKMDDPYGHDSGGETYIKTFFAGFYRIPDNPSPTWRRRLGYHYVEAIDPADGKRYRYTGRLEEPWQKDKHFLQGYIRFVLDKVPAPGAAPRYGVTYDDLSTREEREYWIAGSSLKVIDLQTNEVMAERIGYMMDPGQGANGGGRSPWLHAADHACPAFPFAPGGAFQADQTRNFVTKILKPALEK